MNRSRIHAVGSHEWTPEDGSRKSEGTSPVAAPLPGNLWEGWSMA